MFFYGDCRFSIRLTLFRNLFNGFLLGSAGLHPHGFAARVLRIELLGVAFSYSVREAEFRIGNHLSLGFALLGDAETGNSDVIFGSNLRNQGVEFTVSSGAVF